VLDICAQIALETAPGLCRCLFKIEAIRDRTKVVYAFSGLTSCELLPFKRGKLFRLAYHSLSHARNERFVNFTIAA
jgi:hypothetical protein